MKVLQQYVNNIGNEVEVLTAAGKKLKGVLAAADEEGITLTVQKKVKPEGAKRPVLVDEDVRMAYADTKEVKAVIKF